MGSHLQSSEITPDEQPTERSHLGLGLLRHLQDILDLNAEVRDRALELGTTQQVGFR